MYKIFLSLRYLASHRIIYFSIAGVAIGIMVLIIVTSVMGGFARDIRARIRGIQSHLVVTAPADLVIRDYEELQNKIKDFKHVVECAPRVQWMAWLGYRVIFKNYVTTFIGIDPKFEQGEIRNYFKRGGKKNFDFRYDDGREQQYTGVIVGSEMPPDIGDVINLITARATGGGFAYYDRKFEVVGKFKTGMSEYDSTFIFMDLASACEFLHLKKTADGLRCDLVTDIAITLDDYTKVNDVRKEIDKIIASREFLYTQTWEEAKANLLRAVSIEKNIQIIILFCIIIVAGFNIIAIFTLMVRAKTRDIGILKALGATKNGICTIFLLAGFLCGTIGSVLGIILGLVISFNLNPVVDFIRVHFGIDPFPKDIYYLEAIPAEINMSTIATVVISTMIVSLAFSIYPAIKAAKSDPIEAIRFE